MPGWDGVDGGVKRAQHVKCPRVDPSPVVAVQRAGQRDPRQPREGRLDLNKTAVGQPADGEGLSGQPRNRLIESSEDVVKSPHLLLTAHRDDELGLPRPLAKREEDQLPMVYGNEAQAPLDRACGEEPLDQLLKLEDQGFRPTIRRAVTDG